MRDSSPSDHQFYYCQGLPGAPNNLRFSDITMSSLMVSWDRPKKRNGEIIGYVVSYETAEQNERKYSTVYVETLVWKTGQEERTSLLFFFLVVS